MYLRKETLHSLQHHSVIEVSQVTYVLNQKLNLLPAIIFVTLPVSAGCSRPICDQLDKNSDRAMRPSILSNLEWWVLLVLICSKFGVGY